MMRKIAVVFYRAVPGNYYDYEGTEILVATQITEWTDVSDTDFSKLLKAAETHGFNVIEMPENQPAFIKKSIESVLADIKKEEEQRAAAEQERQQKAAERAAKKLAKNEAERRALFEQLQKEFQNPAS
jgi:SAM-dependent MidA family methyltransferase